jgi:hypothetical protein
LKRCTPPNGRLFVSTVWLCEYCPVNSVAREGQHHAVVTNALLKFVPLSITRPFNFGMSPRLTMRASEWVSRSSASTMTTLGLVEVARDESSAPAACRDPANASRARTMATVSDADSHVKPERADNCTMTTLLVVNRGPSA